MDCNPCATVAAAAESPANGRPLVKRSLVSSSVAGRRRRPAAAFAGAFVCLCADELCSQECAFVCV